MREIIRTLKPTGSFYVFNTPFNSAYFLTFLNEEGMKFRNWITWDKRDGFSSTKKKYNAGQKPFYFLQNQTIIPSMLMIFAFHTNQLLALNTQKQKDY